MSQPAEQSPIDYTAHDRRADNGRGRLDGRKRVPTYTRLAALIDEVGWFTTPYTEALWALGHDLMQAKLLARKHRVAPKRQRLAGLREHLVAAEQKIESALAAVEAEVELTPAELLPRNPLEVERSAEFLRSRRTMMRERRIESARDRQAQRIADVDDLRRSIAEACQDLNQDFELAKARARLLADQTSLRVATYWGAVATTHSEGRQLALLLPYIRSVLPSWISASTDGSDGDGADGGPVDEDGVDTGSTDTDASTPITAQ